MSGESLVEKLAQAAYENREEPWMKQFHLQNEAKRVSAFENLVKATGVNDEVETMLDAVEFQNISFDQIKEWIGKETEEVKVLLRAYFDAKIQKSSEFFSSQELIARLASRNIAVFWDRSKEARITDTGWFEKRTDGQLSLTPEGVAEAENFIRERREQTGTEIPSAQKIEEWYNAYRINPQDYITLVLYMCCQGDGTSLVPKKDLCSYLGATFESQIGRSAAYVNRQDSLSLTLVGIERAEGIVRDLKRMEARDALMAEVNVDLAILKDLYKVPTDTEFKSMEPELSTRDEFLIKIWMLSTNTSDAVSFEDLQGEGIGLIKTLKERASKLDKLVEDKGETVELTPRGLEKAKAAVAFLRRENEPSAKT